MKVSEQFEPRRVRVSCPTCEREFDTTQCQKIMRCPDCDGLVLIIRDLTKEDEYREAS